MGAERGGVEEGVRIGEAVETDGCCRRRGVDSLEHMEGGGAGAGVDLCKDCVGRLGFTPNFSLTCQICCRLCLNIPTCRDFICQILRLLPFLFSTIGGRISQAAWFALLILHCQVFWDLVDGQAEP